MKYFLLILFIKLNCYVYSQHLKIDRIVHDFGVISTWEGVQTTKFILVNETHAVQHYIEFSSSCGCAVVSISKETLQPNDTSIIFVILDPTNEDGKFKKSVSFKFENDKKEIQSIHVNLNGFGLTQKHLDSLQSNSKQREENVKYFYQQSTDIDKFDNSSEGYFDFIKQAKKEVLFNQFVKVQFNLYAKSSNYGYEKVLKSIRKSLIKDLKQEGINEDKVIFGNPTAQLATDTNYIQLSIIQNKKENNEFNSFSPESGTRPNNQGNIANYPIYTQLFTGGINHLDSSSTAFKTFFENLSSLLQSDEKLNILIFSSSSKAPNNVGYTALQMSTLRGERSLNTFINIVLQHDIDTSLLNFKIIPLVGGPEFSTRHYYVQYYYNFQYIKIVASRDEYIPKMNIQSNVFKQHYYSGQSEINTSTENFNLLIRNIAKEINIKGFASLIIESSSSKVPTPQYRTCEVLAYERIKAFKKSLNAYLYQEGIDYRKVIHSEERTLVIGPEYNKDEPNSTYTPFQYIKVYVE